MGISNVVSCGALSLLSIICGHIAKTKIGGLGGAGGVVGIALAGLILGYLSIVLVGVSMIPVEIGSFNDIQQRALMAKSMSNAKQIITGCKIYAADHEGKYPNDLTDLKKENIISEPKVFQDPLLKDGSEIGYEYLGAGMKDSDAPDKVVLKSKGTSMGKRIIGLNNGSVSAVKETPTN